MRFRILSKPGQEIWVQLAAETIAWEGRPGVLCFLRDVTRERTLEVQFIDAQRMEAVGQLAGGIAHEFNNALTAILGFGELLRMRLRGDRDGLRLVDQIMRCVDRASTMTRQLLTSARRVAIEPVNLNLNALIAELTKLIGKVVGERIEVRTALARDLPPIRADRGQVEQVLVNLCLNARDAMPEGGRLLVETKGVYLDDEYARTYPYVRPGRYVLLQVTDSGTGMDEKTRGRIFEPFFTTKAPGKGTGLGLPMVYGIVKQHDGYIHVFSTPGNGTTVDVHFPATEIAPEAVAEAACEAPLHGGMETILLAEDEESVRSLARRVLEDLGYKVLVAGNGEAAVELFRRSEGVALAVLDLVMPGMGGKEAFEAMRRANPGLKAIFMSGYSPDTAAAPEAFAPIAGLPFLSKPFGPVALGNKVREVLDKPWPG